MGRISVASINVRARLGLDGQAEDVGTGCEKSGMDMTSYARLDQSPVRAMAAQYLFKVQGHGTD
jgi:hypothetical protein